MTAELFKMVLKADLSRKGGRGGMHEVGGLRLEAKQGRGGAVQNVQVVRVVRNDGTS